ncbi:hypothetical protein [Alteromonas gilva]|uniref:Uncharacterized protein n=1 Tax=Alteromonas gilva TaxID=2987522 RepID=A0ABT5L410_9ALTE|nr:hypothetical protein [Alteromonas gilva]MDC8831777.1 hypothetical protein [Alteromonas gilva]
MTDTPKNQTLITGQLLQIRDKLMAKRHLIPATYQAQWQQIEAQTAMFDAASQGRFNHQDSASMVKKSAFQGNIDDLMKLVDAMRNLDRQIKIAVH